MGGIVMRVFISWSKESSKQLALALRDWLPDVIQQVEPWVSSEDIEKGQQWLIEVGEQLEDLSEGLLCITPTNQHEPWLNFEAGALAKTLDRGKVRPVLLGIKPTDITGPLAQFQSTSATDQEDMFKLVKSINTSCERPLDPDRLRTSFDRAWNDFSLKVQLIDLGTFKNGNAEERPSDDMLREVLDLVRSMTREPMVGRAARRNLIDSAEIGDGTFVTVGSSVVHRHFGPGRFVGFSEGSLADPTPNAVVDFVNGGGRQILPLNELRARHQRTD
ncbi:TIR domain-containing protein [Actinoplanes sp. URMC 104]|uniref:TIR domain-containing protein n=1 Tax=Actinoplanes sp. URMC 104 TaxID=3423409 RepID=UPI003F1B52AD